MISVWIPVDCQMAVLTTSKPISIAKKRLGSSTTAAAASVGMAIPESHIVRKIALLNRETREITSLESCRMLLVLMLMLLMLLLV